MNDNSKHDNNYHGRDRHGRLMSDFWQGFLTGASCAFIVIGFVLLLSGVGG